MTASCGPPFAILISASSVWYGVKDGTSLERDCFEREIFAMISPMERRIECYKKPSVRSFKITAWARVLLKNTDYDQPSSEVPPDQAAAKKYDRLRKAGKPWGTGPLSRQGTASPETETANSTSAAIRVRL